MTNNNKLNVHQKNLMGEYMKEHPSLAKNLIPNCAQGKCTATRLWEELAKRLNVVGPPIKEAKMWKKVFADQKYQAKKKLSFNKLSKKRTGGGPYEEKLLTQAEEQIVEASGLEAAVEGLQVKKFGNPELSQRTSTPLIEFVDSYQAEESTEVLTDTIFEGAKENVSPPKAKKRKASSQDPKLLLLQQN